MSKNFVKIACVAVMTFMTTAALACPCAKKDCVCGSAERFMSGNAKMMEVDSAKLKHQGKYMKEVAMKNTQPQYRPLNNCLNGHGQFLIDQSEVMMQNGKIVMMYSDEIEGDVFKVPTNKRAQAQMDASKLIDNGQRMRRSAELSREGCMEQSARIASIQDPYVAKKMAEHQSDMIGYLDTVINNANAMIASGELLQAKVR